MKIHAAAFSCVHDGCTYVYVLDVLYVGMTSSVAGARLVFVRDTEMIYADFLTAGTVCADFMDF